MSYEWGRFVYWLNSNAGGIQALSSVVVGALTVVLALYTHRSLKAAHTALQISEQQLRANLLPMLSLKMETEYDGEGMDFGVPRFSKSVNLSIKNIGTASVRVRHLFVVVQKFDGECLKEQYEVELEEFAQRVLIAQEAIGGREIVKIKSREHYDAIYGLHIHASDLSEIAEHHFFWHPTRGMRHSTKPLSITQVKA